MKKKVVIGISLLIGLTLVIMVILFKKKDNNYLFYNNSGAKLAFYYQKDDGNYERSTDSRWTDPTFVLNLEKSSCNGINNPDFLSWDNDTHHVILTRGVSTTCSLYFDKRLVSIFEKCLGAKDLVECITQIDGGETGEENLTSNLCPSDNGKLLN